MKEYTFPDTDKEGYEIIIPDYVTRDIIRDYLQKTYYWTVSLGSFVIGLLVGIII
jgi:hypothetical protein